LSEAVGGGVCDRYELGEFDIRPEKDFLRFRGQHYQFIESGKYSMS